MTKQPFERTSYPVRVEPRKPPAWWDLRPGETIDYASLIRFGGDWDGFVYRRTHGQRVEWLMFAGGN